MAIDKMMDPGAAARAYGNNINIGARSVGGDDKGGVSFSKFLENAAEESIKTMKYGEHMSAKAVTGEADLTDVVEAVSAAEVTLQTVVSIRDRMVSAYQEIMRTPI